MAPPSYANITARVQELGLLVRGGFHPTNEDRVPDIFGSREVSSLVLLGNAGPPMWAKIGPTVSASNATNPLDDWVREHVGELAAELDAIPLYPFGGPPFLPFLHWAQRAEPVAPSEIGILIHPRYGLWHAYRGALAFAEPLDLPQVRHEPRPCDSCADKPCLTTCPVGAFSTDGYDTHACGTHISSPAGADCMDSGCRARRACPIGRDYIYPSDQANFHMAAFLGVRKGTTRL